MFAEDFAAVTKAAKLKSDFLKNNPLGYFLASVLAGIYIGFGILLIFSIGGMMEGALYAKLIMGLSFGVALSLVVMAGAELFTGNNFVMTAGLLDKTVNRKDALKIWTVCFAGNWIGSILLAVMFYAAGFAEGATGQFMADAAASKMGIAFFPLLIRGILCNMLVCLAVWCSFRCKTEAGKLTMIFWCLFAFIATGFEHSIANMTLLTVAMLSPLDAAVSWSGYFYNLFTVTAGNFIAGALVLAVPYYLISKEKGGTTHGVLSERKAG